MGDNKTCSKCGEEKPATLEYFHKDSYIKDGFCSQCKVCRKAYRMANKEAITEQKKTYYETNKEYFAEKNKTYYRTPKGKYRVMKKNAKARNKNFSLSFKLYETQLWGNPCHYCGCEIEVTGLDRRDSSKGYSRDNVVPCCFECNTKKKDKPYEQFIQEQNLSEGHNK